jgi:hypothetical protein
VRYERQKVCFEVASANPKHGICCGRKWQRPFREVRFQGESGRSCVLIRGQPVAVTSSAMSAAGRVNCTARGANNILNTTAARRSCLCADDQRGYADGHSADVLLAGGHSAWAATVLA